MKPHPIPAKKLGAPDLSFEIDFGPNPAALLSGDAPTPLYHRLFVLLRDRIHDGEFPPGTVLPGEQELSRVFQISRITVKRAMNELAAAGLVTRHRGKGTLVTYNAAVPIVKGSFDNLFEALRLMGLNTEVELFEVADTPATPEIAGLLGIEIGALVQRAVRLRRLEGEPFSYLVTHVPADIARAYKPEELGEQPLLSLLEAAGHIADEAEQWISAAGAEPQIAAALKIAPGAPVLAIVRVMRDKAGRGIEAIAGSYRPERFQYHMRLSRRRMGGKDEWR